MIFYSFYTCTYKWNLGLRVNFSVLIDTTHTDSNQTAKGFSHNQNRCHKAHENTAYENAKIQLHT